MSDEPDAKDDASKGEAPKDDAPESETSKGDTSKDDAPKSDATKSDATKSDATKSDAPKDDATPSKPSKDSGTSRVISLLGSEDETQWVRRKIAVFKRLEPSDTRSPGSFVIEESPYIEASLVELRVPKATHTELVALAKKRRDTLSITKGLLQSYDPAGWLVAGGGGGLVGVWLDYLPFAFLWPLVGVVAAGIAVGVATRMAHARAEKEADTRWTASPERKEHDALAKELAEAWARAQATLKRETGYHTDIRVAEGSVDPMRVASIDPRPYSADPPLFDPDDFLPSEEAGSVRYELVHATGEVVTRAIEGTNDFEET
ncbi:MAG: hypothetical protein K1X94_28055 [Sandaracinaceae bacterium]|nr:hypothetical protein [Sandaracinaceae bacterium]